MWPGAGFITDTAAREHTHNSAVKGMAAFSGTNFRFLCTHHCIHRPCVLTALTLTQAHALTPTYGHGCNQLVPLQQCLRSGQRGQLSSPTHAIHSQLKRRSQKSSDHRMQKQTPSSILRSFKNSETR